MAGFTVFSLTGVFILAVYFVAGIVDSVCGGGGLFTVPALMSIGLSAHMVVGTNQGCLILGNVTAIYKYGKNGKIDYKIAACALPFTLVGAFLGAQLNLLIPTRYLQLVMIFLLPVMGILSFFKKDFGQENHPEMVPKKKRYINAALIGLLISTYHAFYGPASGMFYIAAFCIALKYDMINANGVSKVMLLFACSISAVTYAMAGNVEWRIVLTASITYIIGNYIGSTIALTKGAKVVKPVFYCMLVVLFAKLLIDL